MLNFPETLSQQTQTQFFLNDPTHCSSVSAIAQLPPVCSQLGPDLLYILQYRFSKYTGSQVTLAELFTVYFTKYSVECRSV